MDKTQQSKQITFGLISLFYSICLLYAFWTLLFTGLFATIASLVMLLMSYLTMRESYNYFLGEKIAKID